MSIQSVLQFQKYFVNRIDFVVNKDFNSDEIELEFNIDSEVTVGIDNSAVVALECTVFPDYIKSNQPFNLVVRLEGFFEYQNVSDDELKSLLYSNAIAILFPYLRSTITNITGVTGFPALILPTINIHKYLEAKQNDIKE